MLEICEIGEQGVSFVDFELLVSLKTESFLNVTIESSTILMKTPDREGSI